MPHVLELQPDGTYKTVPGTSHPLFECHIQDTGAAQLAHDLLQKDGFVEVSDELGVVTRRLVVESGGVVL